MPFEQYYHPETFRAAPTSPRIASPEALTFQGIPLIPGMSVGTGERRTEAPFFAPQATSLMEVIQNAVQQLAVPTPGRGTLENLNRFLRAPLQSSTFRAMLEPLLTALRPSEQEATRGLEDMFRRAAPAGSGLRGGPFATAAGKLQGDIFGRRAQTAAGLVDPLMARVLQALGLGLQAEQAEAGPQMQVQMDRLRALLELLRSIPGLGQVSEGIRVGPGEGVGGPQRSFSGGGGGGFGGGTSSADALAQHLATNRLRSAIAGFTV